MWGRGYPRALGAALLNPSPCLPSPCLPPAGPSPGLCLVGTQCQPAAPTQVPAAPRGPAGRARSLSVRQRELCSPCAPSCPPTSHRGQTCLLVQAVPCKLRHPSWASSPSNLWWVDHILTPASGRSELAQAVAGPLPEATHRDGAWGPDHSVCPAPSMWSSTQWTPRSVC